MIGKLIRFILMLIGFITLLGGAFLWFQFSPLLTLRQPLPQRVVLEVDLTRPLYEQSSPSFISRHLKGEGTSFYALLRKLYQAAEDPRVASVIVKIGYEGIGMSQIQDLRQAFHNLRTHGKLVYAYTETLEGPAGTKLYYLASACDHITLQPIGSLFLTGLSLEVPFLRPALDKWGIKPQFERREEYKSFSETFTESDFTPAHKEALQSILHAFTEKMVQDMAKDRHQEEETLRNIMNEGPYTASEALSHGLIHSQGFIDEIHSQALERAGGGAILLPFQKYNLSPPLSKERIFKVALVHAQGTIQTDSVGGGIEPGILSSRRLHKIFKEIKADKQVHAVVLRLDSGGGSASASEAIWREIVKLQESGIPVIISMGNTAASGGYLLSASAHHIFAQPSTITGSIGVITGKFVTTGAWDQLGVKWRSLSTAPHALLWSSGHELTPEEQKKMSQLTQATYDRFLNIVAEGRHLPKENLLKIAKGRIWTGSQAKEYGLVDSLGGLYDALEYAKKQISGATDPSQIIVQEFPRPKTVLEQMIILLGYGNSEEESVDLGWGELSTWIFQRFLGTLKSQFLLFIQGVSPESF